MSRSKKSLLAAGVAGAVGLTLWVLPVGAQEDDDDGAPKRERIEAFEERRDEFHQALAEELGVSVEKLEAAIEKVKDAQFDEHLQQLVDDGAITEEQADDMREHREFHEEHEGLMGAGPGGPGLRFGRHRLGR